MTVCTEYKAGFELATYWSQSQRLSFYENLNYLMCIGWTSALLPTNAVASAKGDPGARITSKHKVFTYLSLTVLSRKRRHGNGVKISHPLTARCFPSARKSHKPLLIPEREISAQCMTYVSYVSPTCRWPIKLWKAECICPLWSVLWEMTSLEYTSLLKERR